MSKLTKEEKKVLGICIGISNNNCGNKAGDGTLTCLDCRKKKNDQVKKQRENKPPGTCHEVSCYNLVYGKYKTCEKHLNYRKERAKKAKEEKLCTKCVSKATHGCYCEKCYIAVKAEYDTNVVKNICTACREPKGPEDKNKTCNKCMEKARNRTLIAEYGIPLETYNEMLKKQNGVCYLCKNPEVQKVKGKIRNLAVDHDHETKKVRALLCLKCNTTVGILELNLDSIGKLTDYIQTYSLIDNVNVPEQFLLFDGLLDKDNKRYNTKYRFGIDCAQYNRMLVWQDFVCFLCKKPESAKHQNGEVKSLAVDHNHETNHIRKLLCYKCNSLVGYVEKNLHRMSFLMDYISSHKPNHQLELFAA